MPKLKDCFVCRRLFVATGGVNFCDACQKEFEQKKKEARERSRAILRKFH